MMWLISIIIFSSLSAYAEDITEQFGTEEFKEVFDYPLEVGDINYDFCPASPTMSSATRRIWPAAHHVKFCLETAPNLYTIMKEETSWNDEAIKFSIGWTLAEAGWKHSLNKPNDYCFWGFMKNEKTIACRAKTMKDGFNVWKNYLSRGHRPPNYYVPYRAKSCAPHRTLIKNLKKKECYICLG